MKRQSLMLAAAGAALLLSTAVLADTPTKKTGEPPAKAQMQPADTGHLEYPTGPYVPVPADQRALSPGMRVSRGGYVSVQVNVDANGFNIVGDAANEPSIAVDRNDPTRMAIGWRQFDTISSSFRQAGWGYTQDGGQSWTFPGSIEPGVFRSDPVLASDASGNFFYNSLTADNWDGFPSNFRCKVFMSTDGGMTWDSGVYAYGGDKQWMVCDQTAGVGSGNLYAFWNSVYTCSGCAGHFTWSTDNGQSFRPTINAPGTPYWGVLSVGPDGELYVCGEGFTVARSSTIQNGSTPVQWDLSTTVDLDGSLSVSTGPNPAGLLGQSWIATDHSDGASRGNVYLCASVNRNSTTDPMDVMFARSSNGGTSWSAPVRINDDATNSAYQWFGTMSVAPNGRIDIVWLDTRNDPGGYDSELYYSFSEDAGLTWSPNEALTPSFDPHLGWPQQDKMGDYFHMESDDFGANLAYAATFNGEQDVYYIRIGDPVCPDAGVVELDSPKAACEGFVGVRVRDCGLNLDDGMIDTVTVDVDSTSETGVEQLVLNETSPASAIFAGSLQTSETDAAGVLLVAENDVITVTYLDADDGEGGTNVTVTANGAVDCTPPVISNVQIIDIGPREATVTFDTDEPCSGMIDYGLTCDGLTETTAQSGARTSHSIRLSGLTDQTTYFLAVTATDEAGNATLDDNGAGCYTFATPDIPDFFTEQFTSGIDLEYHSLFFIPDGGVDGYIACIEEITELPTDPAGGTSISLSDDDSEAVTLSGGAMVMLYGQSYSTFYVGSNGYVTFGGSDTDYSEELADHFDLARIAGLFDDLTPGTGSVSWKQLADRAVVTYQNVPQYSESDNNTFQIEMFFDGKIVISFLNLDAPDAIIGLSAGGGLDPDFYQSDLSAVGSCGPRPPTAASASYEIAIADPVTITLEATDDGLPEPAALTFVITSLPSDGVLRDPGAGLITGVPYTLVGGGADVEYDPDNAFLGTDSFQFVANDGGVAPDGGDSDVATIAIDVLPGLPSAAYSFPMDTDPGWTGTGQWAFGVPTGGGTHNLDPTSGYTGDNVYGYNLNGDYSNNMSPQYLTTGALDCSDLLNVELRFWRWLGVESASYDHATLEISTNGSDWTLLWENPSQSLADTVWTEQVFDISAIADGEATVYLRWTMGPTDTSVSYPGWNLDDVEIWAVAVPPQLAGDLDGDCDVDFDDLNLLLASYGQSGAGLTGDIDDDDDVDFDDLNLLLANYGMSCP